MQNAPGEYRALRKGFSLCRSESQLAALPLSYPDPLQNVSVPLLHIQGAGSRQTRTLLTPTCVGLRTASEGGGEGVPARTP